MARYLYLLLFCLISSKIGFSQDLKKPSFSNCIFCPSYNATQDLQQAVKIAQNTHKKIFLIVGGDWDEWTRKADVLLKNWVNNSDKLHYLRINFSPSNKNKAILDSLQCPRNQGYPMILILDESGRTLQTYSIANFRVLQTMDYDKDRLQAFVQQCNQL
jgi:hypothetical protein